MKEYSAIGRECTRARGISRSFLLRLNGHVRAATFVFQEHLSFVNQNRVTMSYFIAAISNGGGAPEQAYRKMQAAGACPEKPFAGKRKRFELGYQTK